MKAKRIYKGDTGDKEWVRVVFEEIGFGLKWLPKLEDIAHIARLLYEVEENK